MNILTTDNPSVCILRENCGLFLSHLFFKKSKIIMPEYLGRNIQTHISNLEILDLKFQASKFILPPQMSHILITSSIAI